MTTFGDQVKEFGGVPVGNNRYAGWWGNDAFYVDDQNGDSANDGKGPTTAKATIQQAVTAAGPQDIIWLRPRNISTGRYHEHGYYTGTIVIPAGAYGLSIVGTAAAGGSTGGNIQCMIEPTASDTAATIQVNTPCVNLENLGVKQIDESTVGGINATSTYGTKQAWGLTVSNCFFKDFQAADSNIGTIVVDTAHWTTIQHCTFRESDMAISAKSTEAAIRGLEIRDCTFTGQASDIDCCIQVGDCKNVIINNCDFLSAKPTAGSRDIFINFNGTASTGIISDCSFSHASKTIAHFVSIAGTILVVDCWGKNADNITT